MHTCGCAREFKMSSEHEDETPALLDGGDDVEEEEEEEEEGLQAEPCRCLFCECEQVSATAALEHCRTQHGVDIISIAATLDCDVYSCIKLINYIRKESPPPSSLLPLPRPPYPWDDDMYLHPVLERDPLLQVDWESESENIVQTTSTATFNLCNGGNEHISRRQCGPEGKAGVYKEALVQALADLQDMRCAMRRLVGDDTADQPPETRPTQHSEVDSDGGEEEEEEEEGYFSTYSHYSIHHEMLSDTVRTEAYQNFITKNPTLFKDKVVLDIGCGTGILSLFAAQCGAKLVVGVDQSAIIYNAMQIVRENGFEDKITLIRGKLEEVQLPINKVDVIVSEWMGYFLLFESMLDTVIFARDKWLRDTSCVYPNVCSMKMVAVSDKSERETRIDFWDSVYGFKMSCMKRDVLREASVQYMEQTSIISSTHTLKEFDVSKVTVSELEFVENFQLTIVQDTICHAIVGFFEAGFLGPQHTEFLKTGPHDTPTHWKQTVFYLQDPIPVHTGDVMEGTLAVSRRKRDPRALDFDLSFTLSSPLCPTQSVTDPHKYGSKYILR